MNDNCRDHVTFEEGVNIEVSSLNVGWITGPAWLLEQISTLSGVTLVGGHFEMGAKHPITVHIGVEDCPPRARLSPEATAILQGRHFYEGCPYIHND